MGCGAKGSTVKKKEENEGLICSTLYREEWESDSILHFFKEFVIINQSWDWNMYEISYNYENQDIGGQLEYWL